MNILTLSQMFPRPANPLSGVFVSEQLRDLRAHGVDASALVPTARHPWTIRRGSQAQQSVAEGLPVTYLPYTHLPLRLSTRFESWSLVRRLLPVVRAEHARVPIDVIHAHQLFPTGYAGVVVGRTLGIPTVCTAHGSDVHTHPSRNRGIARYTRATLRRADHVVAVSRDLARRIGHLESDAAPTTVIYNGIDPERFAEAPNPAALRRRLALPQSGVGIVFVGRLVEAKGILELLSAFRGLQRAIEDVWMVVVGGGPLQASLAEAAHSLPGRLVVAGPVPHGQVADFLNAADLFALPSHGEGVPVAMLEAMACGLPVVATAVGGIPEVVTDGEDGFLVQSGDQEALFAALERIVRDSELRRRMGAAGRRRIAEGFHWSHGSDALIDLYGQLVARR